MRWASKACTPLLVFTLCGAAYADTHQTESKQREIDKLNRRNQQQTAELAQQALEQRWLWTVLGGSVIMLAGAGFFLLRLKRSHGKLAALNIEMQHAKNKLQATLDAIPDLMFEVGLDGRYYDCYSSQPELLAAPADQLLGRTVADVMPADAVEVCLTALREAHEHGMSMGRQLLLSLPHGDFWFELSVAGKPAVAGEYPRFIVMSRDITVRKQLETQALQREQEFRVLVENSPDLIFRYDRDCRRIYANPAVGRLVGRSADSLLNKTPAEAKILSADEADKLIRIIRQVLTTGLPAESEVECLDAYGHPHYFHNRYAPEFDARGEVASVISIARDITGRKRTEEALAVREREFRTLAENIPDHIIRYDAQARKIYVNSKVASHMGVEPGELLGRTPEDPPPEANVIACIGEFSQKLRRVLQTGEQQELEVEVRPVLEGRQIHNVRFVAERDEHGRIVGALAVGRDITELKQAEQEISFMNYALDYLNDAVFLMDTEFRFVYVNDEACRSLDYSRGELLGMAVSDIDPEVDLAKAEAIFALMLQQGHIRLETAHRRKDGHVFPVEIIGSLLEYHGESRIIAVVRDITERKRAEDEIRALNASLELRVLKRTEELRQQTHYLRTLIDTLPMLAWLKDKESRFLVVNQTLAAACSRDVEELVGKSDLDFWPREHAEAYRADDSEVMATGRRKTVEEPFVDAHNGSIWIETFKAPILDEDGSVLGTVGIARDISERKAMEAAREAALAEAERLARLRSEFMARMSHELRTPLNGILGYAQILLGEKRLDERESMMLNMIRQSGEHLLKLINDILDFAKIEAGKQKLNLGDVPLPAFLRNLAGIVSVKAALKQLVFVCDIATDAPEVIRADETRLRQVLLNLLANAVKYTERGWISLRVTVLEPGRLRFEIQDSGIGIDAGQLESIFQPFEQTAFGSGTGLGLSISRDLVRQMGSNIQVSSRLGEGSCFWFDLDMAVVPASGEDRAGGGIDALPEARPIPGEALVTPPLEEIKILYRLAQEGSMRDIIRQAAYLAELDERYRPFAEQLCILAQGYQSKAILEMVERYINKNPTL